MRVSVTVKPNSKKGPLIEASENGSLKVYLPESPVDGKANAALIALLAKYYQVPKSTIQIIRGAKAQQKLISIP